MHSCDRDQNRQLKLNSADRTHCTRSLLLCLGVELMAPALTPALCRLVIQGQDRPFSNLGLLLSLHSTAKKSLFGLSPCCQTDLSEMQIWPVLSCTAHLMYTLVWHLKSYLLTVIFSQFPICSPLLVFPTCRLGSHVLVTTFYMWQKCSASSMDLGNFFKTCEIFLLARPISCL